MELKFVIPNMEKTFGNLEFAGEDKVVQRRIKKERKNDDISKWHCIR